MASVVGIEQRVEALEKKLKGLLKEKKPQDDPEVVRTRKSISDNLCDLLRLLQSDDDAVAEKLWRLCFHKRIDDFRKRIAATPAGPAQRKIVNDFRQYLGDCTRLFDDSAQSLQPQKKPRILSRLCTSLGDIARYRELVSETEEKRWTDATQWYRRAAEYWPESGSAHNQLAVIASYQGRSLVAVYRYERAIACNKPFEVSRNNLKEMLVQAASAPVEDGNRSHQDVFLARCVRLHAYVLLPDVAMKDVTALMDADVINEELPVLLQNRNLRGEVSVAILLCSFFAVTNGEACGRLGSDKLKADFAIKHLRSVAAAFVNQTCLDANAFLEQQSELKNEPQQTLLKSLLPVSLLCDFVTAQGMNLLDQALKTGFEALDQLLSHIPLDEAASYSTNVELDEEELEFAGFIPLGSMYSNAEFHDVKHAATLVRRVLRVRSFVRDFIEAELKLYSYDGRLFSTHPPTVANGAPVGEDDEDEEILFRPAFAGAARTSLPHVPAIGREFPTHTIDPFLFQAQQQPIYPFASGALGNTTWGSVSVPPNAHTFGWAQPGGSTWVPTAQQVSGTSTVPNQIQRPSSRLLSPPPGFQQ